MRIRERRRGSESMKEEEEKISQFLCSKFQMKTPTEKLKDPEGNQRE